MIKKKESGKILKFDSAKKKVAKANANKAAVNNMSNRINELKLEKNQICEMAAKTILKALDLKDNYTFAHSIRTCHYSLLLGQELGLSDHECYELQLSALFHDIGKIGTPDAVLNKPTRLSDEEFKIMKVHAEKSYDILKDFEAFENVAKAVRHHHERYDGRGYPDNLKGEAIPKYARIILIADTFDAMTSNRVYRKGLPSEVAFNDLIEFSGSQFDPGLVKKFISAVQKEEQKEEDSFYIPLMEESYKKNAA